MSRNDDWNDNMMQLYLVDLTFNIVLFFALLFNVRIYLNVLLILFLSSAESANLLLDLDLLL